MRIFGKSLFLASVLLFGCGVDRMNVEAPTSSSAPSQQHSELSGDYYRGDGLGYNISLHLQADHNYSATWRGCLGVYGTAHGTWSFENGTLHLDPQGENNSLRGVLRDFEVRQVDGSTILIPTNDREPFERNGVSRNSCFQKEKAN